MNIYSIFKHSAIIILISLSFLKCKQSTVQEYSAIKTNIEPTIDGNIDSIWDITSFAPIKKIKLKRNIKDSLDLSANFKMIWNNNNLFILFDINDNSLFNLNQLKYKEVDAPARWECDCIELFFDSKNLKKKSFNLSEGNYKYEIVYSSDYVSSQYSCPTDNIAYAIKDKSYGYIVEIKVPFNTINIKPENMLVFGFETDVSDNDDDPKKGVFLMDRKVLSWSEEGMSTDAWRYTSVYGNVKLISKSK